MSINKHLNSIVTKPSSSTHEAEYNRWFKEKVEKAMNDTRPTIHHDQVVDHLQKRRVEQNKNFQSAIRGCGTPDF